MPRKKGTKNTAVKKKSDTPMQEVFPAEPAQSRWGESYVSLLLGALVVVVAAMLGFFYVKLQQPKQELLPPASIARNINVTVALTNPATLHTDTAQTNTPTPTKPVATVTHAMQHIQKQAAQIPTKPVEKTQNAAAKQIAASNNQKIYTVQKGENLWTIAQKEYGSGYNYVSIEQANHLATPGLIFSGDKLVIPSVTPILVKQQVSATPMSTIKPIATATPVPTRSTSSWSATATTPTIAFHGIRYTVQRGDNLWDLAVKSYGNGYRWVDIAKANHLTNPGIINAGNSLVIPRP